MYSCCFEGRWSALGSEFGVSWGHVRCVLSSLSSPLYFSSFVPGAGSIGIKLSCPLSARLSVDLGFAGGPSCPSYAVNYC